MSDSPKPPAQKQSATAQLEELKVIMEHVGATIAESNKYLSSIEWCAVAVFRIVMAAFVLWLISGFFAIAEEASKY